MVKPKLLNTVFEIKMKAPEDVTIRRLSPAGSGNIPLRGEVLSFPIPYGHLHHFEDSLLVCPVR